MSATTARPPGRFRRWGATGTVAGLLALTVGCGGSARPAPVAGVGTAAFTWGTPSAAALAGPATRRPRSLVLPAGTRMIAAGAAGFLAVADGRLWADTAGSGLQPVPLGHGTVSTVAAGSTALYAVDGSGTVYAWGADDAGQLGDGGGRARTVPAPVALPGSSPVVDLAAGARFALAVTAAGRVWAWGSDAQSQLGGGAGSGPVAVTLPDLGPDQVVAVAAGDRSGYALTRSGAVFSWGADTFGQLGRGPAAPDRPGRVALPGAATAIAAGAGFAVVVLADGSARAWGDNADGELGDGSTLSSATPVVVRLGSVTLADVTAAGRFAVGRGRDGRLVGWGDDSYGQLGDGATTDRTLADLVRLPGAATVTAIAASAGAVTVLPTPAAPRAILATARVRGADGRVVVTATVIDAAGRSLGPLDPAAATVTMAGGTCAEATCVTNTPGVHEIQVGLTGAPTVVGRTRVAVGTDRTAPVFTFPVPAEPSAGPDPWIGLVLFALGLAAVAGRLARRTREWRS